MTRKKLGIIPRVLLIIAGTFFLILGIIGIFLPLLPTTPFLLLTAGCYIRSSDRLYDWLIGLRYIGSYIKNYRIGRGVPINVKIFTIALLWITLFISIFFLRDIPIIVLILVLVGICVTVHLLILKTYRG